MISRHAANSADQSSADEASLRQAITAQAFAFRELAAATDHFTPYNLVGEGGFFRVYKGKLEKSEQVRERARIFLALLCASNMFGWALSERTKHLSLPRPRPWPSSSWTSTASRTTRRP